MRISLYIPRDIFYISVLTIFYLPKTAFSHTIL